MLQIYCVASTVVVDLLAKFSRSTCTTIMYYLQVITSLHFKLMSRLAGTKVLNLKSTTESTFTLKYKKIRKKHGNYQNPDLHSVRRMGVSTIGGKFIVCHGNFFKNISGAVIYMFIVPLNIYISSVQLQDDTSNLGAETGDLNLQLYAPQYMY